MNAEMARCLFTYDGVLRWKETRSSNAKASSEAGNKRRDGYIKVRFGGKNYLGHRIVWMLHYGDIPEGGEIDHINCDPSNNSIENLRISSRLKNAANLKHRTRQLPRGISFNKKANMFHVRFAKNKEFFWGGGFHCLKEATKAAAKLGSELFGSSYKTIEVPDDV